MRISRRTYACQPITQGQEGTRKQTNACTKIYKFCESLHRFLGRPSLLVVFVRNHGVHSRIRAGQRSDCIVRTLCTICCLRLCWRSHQSVSLYFAASSSLRQVALCVYSTQVSFGRRLTPTNEPQHSSPVGSQESLSVRPHRPA